MSLHIGQGFAAIDAAPDAPIDNMMILATQVSTIAARISFGGRHPYVSGPQGCMV